MDASTQRACLILADDNADLVASLAALLRFELPDEVDVVIAHDGMTALDEVARAPNVLAVVLDLGMPCMSGLETASAIRRLQSPARDAVLIAVSGDEYLLVRAQRSGHFLMTQRKPIDFPRLLNALTDLAEGAAGSRRM
jgi:CheY-like chemotaxis protein